LRALDLTVQGADRGEQVVDAGGRRRLGLLEAPAELVAHPREALLRLGVVREGLELRPGKRRQVGADFATEDSGESVADGHDLVRDQESGASKGRGIWGTRRGRATDRGLAGKWRGTSRDSKPSLIHDRGHGAPDVSDPPPWTSDPAIMADLPG